MERASLALRIPPQLLPSSRGGAGAEDSLSSDSVSVDSELRGLERRTVGHGARSASRPAAPRQQSADGVLTRSPTGLAPVSAGKHGGIALTTVHVDATARWDGAAPHVAPQQTAAPAGPPPALPPPPVVERRGSRAGGQADTRHGKPTGAAPSPAAAASSTRGAQQPPASTCSASPDGYSDDGFEAENSQRPSSPSSTVRTTTTAAGTASARAAAGPVRKLGASPGSGSGSSKPSSRPSSGRCSPSSPPSRTASRLGYLAATAATEAKRSASAAHSRPCSASPHKQQQPTRPPSPFPGEARTQEALEARVSKQMCRDPAEWTVREVCDWTELIGLGQYRRKLVHHAVGGALLLRLTSEELKSEVGIGPLGHREGLLDAVNDLEQYWRQQLQQRAQGQAQGQAAAEGEYSADWGSPAGSRPASPPPRLADCSLQRAYAQRARLLRDLEKAESREAHRRVAAEQAMRVVGQASEEVRKLQASIWEIDREIGWEAAAAQQHCHALDLHGAVAWQPAGRQTPKPRPRAVSPDVRPGSGSSGSGGGSPMSRVSRRIMEAQAAEGGGGSSFLERLSKDIASRQGKAAAAARQAGRYVGGADKQLAEQERGMRDVQFIREVVEAKSSELAEALGSGEEARVAEACDGAAVSLQQEWGLSNDAVAAVRRLGSAAKKAGRLAGALRSTQFMQRLQHDLSTREGRLRELQDKYFKLEAGNSAEQQEKADLAAAQRHFALLGWSAADLEVAPGEEAAACDELLRALLRRAAALQEARQRGKSGVDWQGPEWRLDGLDKLQREHNVTLQAALDEQKAAAEAAAAQQAAGRRNYAQPAAQQKELPQPGDHVGDTVDLLAACRPAEVALLEGLGGYRKLVMAWRAVRAQQFVAFTRHDLELRKAKAAALQRQLYPDTTKRLAREEFEAFFERLMADTARRAQHRDELAEEARAEALAKLKSTAPPPLNHQRQQRAASPAPAAQPTSGDS